MENPWQSSLCLAILVSYALLLPVCYFFPLLAKYSFLPRNVDFVSNQNLHLRYQLFFFFSWECSCNLCVKILVRRNRFKAGFQQVCRNLFWLFWEWHRFRIFELPHSRSLSRLVNQDSRILQRWVNNFRVVCLKIWIGQNCTTRQGNISTYRGSGQRLLKCISSF